MPLILSTLNCCRAAVVAWVGPPTRIGVVKKPTLEVFFSKKPQKTPSFHVSSCFPSCLSKSSIFFERKIERYEDTESLPCLASQRSRFLTPQLSHGTLHPKLVGSWALLGGLQRPPFAVAATGWKSCSPVIPLDAYIYIYTYVHIILVWFQKKKNIYQL